MTTTTDLTPAQKAQRTRSMKKANAAYEEMIAPAYQQWVEALDRFVPPRDAVIDGLETKRDAAIALITAEFQKEYDAVMESYNNLMKPTQDVLDEARNNAWEIHKDGIMGKGSVYFGEAK
jgi:hypothetical protein